MTYDKKDNCAGVITVRLFETIGEEIQKNEIRKRKPAEPPKPFYFRGKCLI